MPVVGRLTKTSSRRLKYLYAAFVIVLCFNICMVYMYFFQPYVTDPFLSFMDYLKFFIKHEPWGLMMAAVFLYLNVCLYICAGFILGSVS